MLVQFRAVQVVLPVRVLLQNGDSFRPVIVATGILATGFQPAVKLGGRPGGRIDPLPEPPFIARIEVLLVIEAGKLRHVRGVAGGPPAAHQRHHGLPLPLRLVHALGQNLRSIPAGGLRDIPASAVPTAPSGVGIRIEVPHIPAEHRFQQFSVVGRILPAMLAALVEPPEVLAPIAHVARRHKDQTIELGGEVPALAASGDVEVPDGEPGHLFQLGRARHADEALRPEIVPVGPIVVEQLQEPGRGGLLEIRFGHSLHLLQGVLFALAERDQDGQRSLASWRGQANGSIIHLAGSGRAADHPGAQRGEGVQIQREGLVGFLAELLRQLDVLADRGHGGDRGMRTRLHLGRTQHPQINRDGPGFVAIVRNLDGDHILLIPREGADADAPAGHLRNRIVDGEVIARGVIPEDIVAHVDVHEPAAIAVERVGIEGGGRGIPESEDVGMVELHVQLRLLRAGPEQGAHAAVSDWEAALGARPQRHREVQVGSANQRGIVHGNESPLGLARDRCGRPWQRTYKSRQDGEDEAARGAYNSGVHRDRVRRLHSNWHQCTDRTSTAEQSENKRIGRPTVLRQPLAERKATGEATAELQILPLEVVPLKGGSSVPEEEF